MIKVTFFSFILLAASLIVSSAQSLEPYRIGVINDMSGATSQWGIASKRSIEMAVDEINDAGGLNGRKLQIFLEDDQGKPEPSQTAAKKLINEKKVQVIIGPVSSSNSLAVAYGVEKMNIPLLVPTASNPNVAEVSNYIFNVSFVDPLQGEAMAKFAFSELGVRRVAIMSDASSDYSKSLKTTFIDTFQKLGGGIVIEQTYSQIEQDFKTQIKAIRRKKPDAIYLPGYYGESSIIARQTRDLGLKIPILGGDGWNSPELFKLGGDGLKNTYITEHFTNDDPSAAVKTFVEKFTSKYGVKPDAIAALYYDSIYLLADALKRTKSLEGPDIRDALAGTKTFEGVAGKISGFNSLRHPGKAVVILKTNEKKGQFVYRSTIYP